MNKGKRILVIAHGHPDFSRGGAEIAAHSIFIGYKRHPGVDAAWFLARGESDGTTCGISRHKANEYLWRQGLADDFYMKGRDIHSTLTMFRDFLKSLNPDVVHLHHAVHMGYEVLEVIRRVLPHAKIIFTLHEYIPICHNAGLMVKSNGKLCERSGYVSCNQCFPQKSPADFWMRKRGFMHYFSHVDVFLAPSDFLRRRYVEWGLPQEKIHVQENCLRMLETCQARKFQHGETCNRFGFFGQINPFKGIETLLRAIRLLPQQTRKEMVLEIHGEGCGELAKDHENKIRREYGNLLKEGTVRWMGAYGPEQIPARMAGVDWVLMPSVWWENSPVVIQEAFACGRPVIASNLGGMAEKVRDMIDGILVEPGNPQAWLDVILECSKNQSLWSRLRGNISAPVSIDEATNKHLELVNELF